ILKRSLAFTKEYGFTQQSIRHGLEELNYPSVTMGIFRHPEVELLDYFLTKAKEESVVKVEEEVLKSMTQEQKLEYLCWNRLSYNKKYIKVLPEAFAHFASINGSSMALEQLKVLMNEIQYKSGDKSFNMEWYKKRIGLAMVYTSTELFMFQDLSEDFQLSEMFLKDRMKEINDVKLLAEDVSCCYFYN
ncbi:rpsU-divergently transcribed protein, partial [Neoconidiobolus thromboides FSU 785]